MIRIICKLFLKCFGWQLDKRVPTAARYILIGYPHTSNWDFILAMLAKGALNLRFHWVAKDSLFWWPLGPLMRAMGGIPVNRKISTGFIDQLTLRYQQQEHIAIVITPEGTRSFRDYWKSGFYHLALSAKVPVALGYVDFSTKELGIGPLIELSGDLDKDLTIIREFYADKVGLNPQDAGTIRFRQKSK